MPTIIEKPYKPLPVGPYQKLPELHQYDWPVSHKFSEFNSFIKELLSLDLDAQRNHLLLSGQNSEKHGQDINEALGQIYDYVYGYKNSPCYMITNDDLEIKLQQIKILLERELIEWLKIPSFPQGLDQLEAGEYLNQLIENNTGLYHKLYDYIATKASKKAVLTFLHTETVRTEVVDDEVCFMTIGLQGPLKKSSISNCWDECGNGDFTKFHTYWLRMLLEKTQTWEYFANYREQEMPWFAKLTSNSYNVLLTRPGYKYAGYGDFIMGESWVPPHFASILEGMKRVGFDHEDETIYFEKHVKIDPFHTKELIDGLAYQEPKLTPDEVNQFLFGAHVMIAAATAQYDRMLPYLSSL